MTDCQEEDGWGAICIRSSNVIMCLESPTIIVGRIGILAVSEAQRWSWWVDLFVGTNDGKTRRKRLAIEEEKRNKIIKHRFDWLIVEAVVISGSLFLVLGAFYIKTALGMLLCLPVCVLVYTGSSQLINYTCCDP